MRNTYLKPKQGYLGVRLFANANKVRADCGCRTERRAIIEGFQEISAKLGNGEYKEGIQIIQWALSGDTSGSKILIPNMIDTETREWTWTRTRRKLVVVVEHTLRCMDKSRMKTEHTMEPGL